MAKKTYSIIIVLLLLCSGITSGAVPVILTAGQSNADGRVPTSELPEYIHYDYCQWSYGSGEYLKATGSFKPFVPTVGRKDLGNRWGFDAIVYYLLEQHWQQPFYVIKQTMGGTAIDTTCTNSTLGWYWSVDAQQKSLLKAFCQQIDNCLNQLPKDYDIKCLLWHQGESDMAAADRYHDNLRSVVAYIRQYLVKRTGRKKYASLPVICGTFAKGSRQGSQKVVDALYQLEKEDKHFHVVDASDLSLQNDQIHFDARGAIDLGRRVFAKMRETSIVTNGKSVVWFDGQHPITYQIPKKVEPVVKIALDMWMGDMQQVTGMRPQASASGMIKVAHNASLPHDGFRIQVNRGRILVEGGNGRGMAYGLLELSRLAGVSPWIWWGDVVPEKKDRLVIDEHFAMEQSPSVEYRGIFLNDEDWSLRHWSYSHFEPAPFGHIGPQTYKKIFLLLLRLRANAIWPAMHTGTTAFFKILGAKAMADSCGIVIGTSHCEPLLRNNVDEWDAAERGDFNYRTNREAVHQYWIERLQEVKKSKDNMFTIGMRGIHDSSMEGYKTEQEKFNGLQQVINDQQELLRKYIGDPAKQMQVFVPYKEVLQLYEKGLQVPDYVTLMWCDDNYGYMTRLSNVEEQQRTGGGGVYYHLSYWGRPHDYLWLTTTQPGLVYNEMRQAYDHNVRKLWIVNVHDVKVAGYDLELFLDMAWNIDGVSGETLNEHYQSWLCREFGQEVGKRLFPVMHEFYQLCGMRRPEFMGWNQVEVDKKLYDRGLSQVRNSDWTQEQCDWFEGRFAALSQKIEEIGKFVRPSLGDAYFAAIRYPVQAAAAHCEKMLEAQRARKFANGSTRSDIFENQEELRQAVARSHAAYERIHRLTDYYNSQMAGGKWKNLMCDHPRDLPVFWAPLTPTVSEKIEVRSEKCTEKEDCPFTPVNACDYTSASEGVKVIQMLGHSMKAVALPKDGSLTYRFDVGEDGEYTLQTALIPTQPNDNGNLRYSVSIDSGEPVIYDLKEPFRSEEWKLNVLRGQALRQQKTCLSKGSHTLTIHALDTHIVVDQWSLISALP